MLQRTTPTHLNIVLTLFLSIFMSFIAYSQLPQCDKVYVHGTDNRIYTYNPATNTTSVNSINMPSGAIGLAVANNFFNSAPSPTFYTVVSGRYYYYNGTTWINTGHSSGGTSAVNPGGAGPYIYNVDGVNDRIYQYNGTGNSTLFLTISTNGPYDCMGDANGNLYIINGNQLRMYNTSGQLVCTYTLVGYNNSGIGGGYSIVNGIVYANNGTQTYRGIINGSTITFTPFTFPGVTSMGDFANCAFPPLNASIATPSTLTCANSTVQLNATTTISSPIYSWTGPGIVSGGNTANPIVNQPGTYTVTITAGSGGTGGCSGTATQSVTVISTGATNFTASAVCSGGNPVFSGGITVPTSMTAGTLIVSSSCGGSQTFNLPAQTVGSGVLTYNLPYSFTGSSGGGANCNVTVTFSNYASCNQTISVTNPNCCSLPAPTITTSAATCSAAGSSTITNYSSSNTYTFTPAGPTVGAGGVINGMTPGTSYTVTAGTSGCTSNASASFTNGAQLTNPVTPTITTTAPTCSAASVSTITNHNGAYTYTFTPTGPTVGTGGVISGMTIGTSYTVVASSGTCNSPISAAFVNAVQLPAPPTPTITTTPPTCTAAGTSTITNYSSSNTYTFTPAGPTVGAGGVISGMTIGTSYTVTATNSGCTSPASASFTNGAQLANPVTPTITTTAPTCSAASVSTITNYNGAYTYTFTPTGPSVGTGGVISGMTIGTSYTVVASLGTCNSPVSSSFVNAAQLATPAAPVISTTSASCSVMGTVTITGYTGTPSDYSFTPTGPTVGAGGVINGANAGTPYSVNVTNASGCISTGTNFTISPQFSTPIIDAGIDIAICNGSSTTITASGGVTYSWDNGVGAGASHTVSPTTTTTYTVTGTDGNGCSNTDQVIVTVNPLPTATISGMADICQNGTAPTVTFTGANGTAPYTFTYTINNGSTQTIVSTGTTATIAVPTNASGTFTYDLVSVQDASSTTCSNPQTGSIVVVVKPKPVVTLNTSNTTICSGSGVTITPSSTPTGATFGWTVQNVNTTGASNGSGTVIADNLSTTGITAGTTTYTVTATLNGCVSDPVNSAITVNAVPVASAQGQTICSGATTSININSNIPNTTFSWTTVASGVTGASNGTGAQINQTLTTLTGGTVTYTVTPTFGTCSGTPINVVVNVNATPTVVATPANSDVCAGSSVTLTASGASTYVWSPAAGLSSTTGTSVMATPSATTTYTVTGTNANGCIGTSQATVIVRPFPVLVVSPDTVICLGETTPLTASGATTYTWTPATGLDQTTGANVNASPTIMTTYVVKGTTNGCSTIDSIKVGVNTLPTVDAGVDQSVCKGVPVIVTATSPANLTYVWSDGIVNGVPFVTDTTRTYTVTGIDANGCKNIDYITITTIDAPEITFIADTTLGCSPLHVQFTNTTEGATSYLWDFGDGQTSTMKNAYHDYYLEGCHDVTLTAENGLGCSISITMDDYICVLPSPIAAFTATTYDITNVMNEVFFHNESQDATTYEWSFGDETGTSSVTNPKHTYDPTVIRNHTVILVATNDDRCTDTARAVIKMTEDVVFFVPNSFTPDGDEYNNIFRPVFVEGFDGFEYEMLIFDRWGEVIFETHNLNYGWDGTYQLVGGKICQDGVYTWKITVKKKEADERITKSGHVTLIR